MAMELVTQIRKVFLFFELILVIFVRSEVEQGCTGPPVIPDKPFVVVWNVPSGKCLSAQNMSNYGFVVNTDDKFTGDLMTLFYDTGDLPSIKNGKINNGGIPQLGDLNLHLFKLSTAINNTIPNEDYQGVAVLDFESWRPLFQANYDSLAIYQQYSIALVEKQHPDWTNKTQIKLQAIHDFNASARRFWYSTLKTARTLRPGGHWGFYGFPRCNCTGENEQLEWLWRVSSGLFPRIYTSVKQSVQSRLKEIEGIVNETLRIKAKYLDPNMLILPYTLIQSGPTYFFSESDLDLAIKLPGDIGSSGVVIWGSSSPFRTHGECAVLKAYVNNILGPYVFKLTNFYANCSKKLCHGHGRCVLKKYELKYQEDLLRYGRSNCKKSMHDVNEMKNHIHDDVKSINNLNTDDYICSCYTGWKGSSCNVKMF